MGLKKVCLIFAIELQEDFYIRMLKVSEGKCETK